MISMNAIRQSPLLRAAASISLIAICIALLIGLRELEPAPTDRTLALHGAFDVSGHLITALIIGIGVRALRLPVPLWSILLGGIVLDIGHLLTDLDLLEQLQGSSRNGSHSLFVVAVLALIGFVDWRHANIWLGLAMGASSHLWRDMGTGTVALLWPLTDTVYGTLFNRYLAVLGGIAVAMIGSATLLALHAMSVPPDPAAPETPPSIYGVDREPTRS